MIAPDFPFDPNHELTMKQEMLAVASEVVHHAARRIVAETAIVEDMGILVRQRTLRLRQISGNQPVLWLKVPEPSEDTSTDLQHIHGAHLLTGYERAAINLRLPDRAADDRLSGKYTIYRALDKKQEHNIFDFRPDNQLLGRSVLVRNFDLSNAIAGVGRALQLASFMIESMDSDIYVWS